MEENIQNTGCPKLAKAYTFFIVPFYYEGEWGEIHKYISRWIPQQENMYKEDILYPYIMELFKQADPQKDSPTNRLAIYQLKIKDEGSNSDFFFDRLLGKNQVAILEQSPHDHKTPYAIPFKFLNDGNYAPHLFISPSAQIGIMTICAELGNGCSTQDLELFNYYLHKRNETVDVVIGEQEFPDGRKRKKKDKRTSNYRIVCPLPETNKSLSDAEIMNSVKPYLNLDGYKQLTNEVQKINNEHINWDFNNFIGFLLNTLGWNSQVKYFNKERLHIYTFCSIDSSASTIKEITVDTIAPEALRLSRVVNSKYLLPYDEMLQKGALLQTYQNIYFSSAIEGTSMICIATDVNKSFIVDMQNKFNRQYLLVYLLVLLQRYTLLSIDRKLTEYDARNDNSDEVLWDLIKLICKIKVNCYYTDVSVYTQHSQFYQHCCKNLHIPDTFNEIDEKVELLKLTTDRRMQQLMKEQKALQEVEAKKQEAERERQKRREADLKAQREEQLLKEANEKDAAERRQRILNWIVGVLTIAQVMQAAYELLKDEEQKDYGSLYISLVMGAICAILLLTLMWKDLNDFFSKLFKKNDNTK